MAAHAQDPGAAAANRFREAAAERLRPGVDARGLFVTNGPSVLGHLQPGFGFWMSYARDVQAREYGPIETVVAGHLRLALGLFDEVELTAGLPVMLMRSDDPALGSEGLGDAEVGLKMRFVGENDDPGLALGAAVSAALSVGDDGPFL